MKLSLNGFFKTLLRKERLDKADRYVIQEFLDNFNETKEAYENDNIETVKQFFEIYC